MSEIEETIQGGLARKRLGMGSLIFFTVSASAPMTVLAGGVVAAFAISGDVGTPLAFPIIAVALLLFSVGYATMSRYIFNSGALYSYISQGLGGVWGVAGSFTALIGYNSIQIALYGLFGYAATGFAAQHASAVTWNWWVWAIIAWVVVGMCGVLRIDLNAKVLSVLLVAEVAAVLLFDLSAFTHPEGGHISFAGFDPDNLFAPGVGIVFAFGIACFVGFEQAAVYSEEAIDPRRTVARATYGAVVITGVLYAASAWALTVAIGPDRVIPTTQDPTSGVPFSFMRTHLGAAVADTANLLLITSVFAALLSFHNGVARYLYALGRERVLPSALGRTGPGSSAPQSGSLIQSALALAVILVFVVLRLDPFTQLFTWGSYVSAIGVLLLMIGTSLAVIGFFVRRRGGHETAWQRLVAPSLAAFALTSITLITIQNSTAVIGVEKSSSVTWVLPGLVIGTAVLGLCWGLILKAAKPDVYRGIGLAGSDTDLMTEIHEPAWHDAARHSAAAGYRRDSR